MDAQRWQRIEELFHAAVELPEGEREVFVVAACNDDPDVGAELLAMLEEDKRGVSRLGREVAYVVDRVLAGAGTSASFIPPERIGPYLREEFLGRGGMGLVWKYLRVDTGQPMAIKFLSLPLSDAQYEERRRRFADEINMLARLRHPHIVAFHDAGALDDGTQWFVMDYVEEFARGKGYTEYIRQSGRLVEARLRHFRTICEAVLYAHRQGILHRDLKPSNILVDRDESPRIVDFGIARELPKGGEAENPTSPTSRFMSPDYAAPEWKRGAPGNVATDVYSLGVILYEVLAGRHPYRDPAQPAAFDVDQTRELPEKPSVVVTRGSGDGAGEALPRTVWSDLDKLCLTAMHPDPHERYASVESLIRDVDHFLNNEPLEAQPGLFRYRAGKFLRRHRSTVIAAITMLMLIVSLVAFFMWRLARERDQAETEAVRTRRIQEFMLSFMGNGAAPPQSLTLSTVLDRSVASVSSLNLDPETQTELYSTLGSAYEEMNDLHRADDLLTFALEKANSLPDPSAERARVLLNLAALRGDEAHYPEAEKFMNQALAVISRLHLTSGDPLPGLAQVELGKILIQEGSYNHAIDVLIPVTKSVISNDNAINVLNSASYLAVAYQDLGNAEASESSSRLALEMGRRVYGDAHPTVAEALSNLGTAEAGFGRFAEAEKLYGQAARILESYYGSNNPETIQVESFAATMAIRDGNYTNADALLKKVLLVQEREFGSDPNPNVAFTHNALGQLAMAKKEFDTAEREFSISAKMNAALYGEDDLKTAQAMSNLAHALIKEGQYERAERVAQVAASAFTKHPLPGNMNVAVAELRLGEALLGQERFREALDPLSKACEQLKTAPPSFASQFDESRRALMRVHMVLDGTGTAQESNKGADSSNRSQ